MIWLGMTEENYTAMTQSLAGVAVAMAEEALKTPKRNKAHREYADAATQIEVFLSLMQTQHDNDQNPFSLIRIIAEEPRKWPTPQYGKVLTEIAKTAEAMEIITT